jgi:hypothetical protein
VRVVAVRNSRAGASVRFGPEGEPSGEASGAAGAVGQTGQRAGGATVAGGDHLSGGGLPAKATGTPTSRERRRLWMWVAFLGFSPVCLGIVAWAAVAWNGSYPTVAPVVPKGWQPVAGIYASFSTPKGWVLQPGMADAQGDAYYSGPGGAAGEMVRPASTPPRPTRQVPAVIATFLGGHYTVESITPYRLRYASAAWRYRFNLGRGEHALGILAWVRPTQSEVWLVALPASATAQKVLSTLTVAS